VNRGRAGCSQYWSAGVGGSASLIKKLHGVG
jgi:hypothetical protein